MNTKTKRIIKRLAIIAASVAFVLIAIDIIIAYQAGRYIRNHLKEAVSDATDGLYELKSGKINVDLLQGYLSAKDIELTINPERYKQLEEVDSLPDIAGIAKIKTLQLTGVNLKYTRKHGKKLGFKHLIIEEPEVIALINSKEKELNNRKDGADYKPKKVISSPTLYDFIAPYFDEFSISNVSLSGGNIFLQQKKDGKIKPMASLTGWGIEAADFRVNSDRTLNNSVFYTDDIIVSFENLTVHSGDGFYDYVAGNTSLDVGKGRLSIDQLSMISPIPKWEFAKVHPTHADWFDVRVGAIDLIGLDIKKLTEERTVMADTLSVGSAVLQNFKNGQIPIEHNYMPMIYTSRQNLPFPFFLEYVKVNNMEVIYEELAVNETNPGRVILTELEGVFLDYTNITSTPKQTTTLYASGKLMGEGELEAVIKLPVDPEYDRVEFEARMGVMNMISLNPIIETMAPFKLDGGFIQGLDIYIDASGEKAHVDLTLRYNDLSVQLLQSLDDGQKAGLGIVSFFANGLIEQDNPRPGEEVRVVHADHIRDPLHSSFNYLWKIIVSGLVKVLGYTDDRQEKVSWVIEVLNK